MPDGFRKEPPFPAGSGREAFWAGVPEEPAQPELAALRKLLLHRETVLLDRLCRRLDDPATRAEDVGGVVAEALLMRAGKDDKLAVALEPVVEKIFKDALRKSPLDFANALFPLMGPAIRRSIAESFRGMLEGFKNALEMSLSWKGARWRFEAWRTGRPFSEVVLLHTLLYRVEQVFLIHSETGLLLVHESSDGIAGQDADMVSAMLTAIQDFARDCFAGGRDEALDTLTFGDFTILIEKNALACLACVVRGTPPHNFREELRGCLERVTADCYNALLDFDGDNAPFAFARPHIERCLSARFVDENAPFPLWFKALPIVLLLVLGGAIGYRIHAGSIQEEAMRREAKAQEEERQRVTEAMESGIEALRREPGLIVIGVADKGASPWSVACLKDELAPAPLETIRKAGADPAAYTITAIPFISLEPDIVTRRVARAIMPPEGAAIRFDGATGTLFLSGSAPMEWILEARQEALSLPGVRHVNLEGISDPRIHTLQALVAEVESAAIFFPSNRDTPAPQDMPALEKAVASLAALESLAAEMGLTARLTIYGHADSSGSPKHNYELSQARARTLAAMLYAKGSSLPVAMYGMGAEYAKDQPDRKEGPASQDRRIELRVQLAPAPLGTADLFRFP